MNYIKIIGRFLRQMGKPFMHYYLRRHTKEKVIRDYLKKHEN
ncbi:hypothetical protein [Dysgonomonas sp.]